MKIFIVNLKQAHERREFMKSQLEKLNLEFEFIDAVDGRLLTNEQRAEMVKEGFDQFLLPGEIGCSLSHIKIYKHIVENKLDHALIFEDDTIVPDDLLDLINHIEMNKNPEVILLSKPCRVIENNPVKITEKYSKFKALSALGTYGYIINFHAAKNLYQATFPVWLHTDDWMKFVDLHLIKLNVVLPVVCTLSDYSNKTTVGDQNKRDELFKIHKRYVKRFIPLKYKLLKGVYKLYVAIFCKQKTF